MIDSTRIDLCIGERTYHTTARLAYFEIVLTWGCRATVAQALAYGMGEDDAAAFADYAAHRMGLH